MGTTGLLSTENTKQAMWLLKDSHVSFEFFRGIYEHICTSTWFIQTLLSRQMAVSRICYFCTASRPREGVGLETMLRTFTIKWNTRKIYVLLTPKNGEKLRVQRRCYCWLQLSCFPWSTLLILICLEGSGRESFLTRLHAVFFFFSKDKVKKNSPREWQRLMG